MTVRLVPFPTPLFCGFTIPLSILGSNILLCSAYTSSCSIHPMDLPDFGQFQRTVSAWRFFHISLLPYISVKRIRLRCGQPILTCTSYLGDTHCSCTLSWPLVRNIPVSRIYDRLDILFIQAKDRVGKSCDTLPLNKYVLWKYRM